ncbi:MarR family transcriptional regulator [Actinomadura sp. NPDC047616]|uniref:MarR family winged helix-turn-helix transcriptional regulator n=1 Tax=Actinomadura sp. NPDC047616 TaxID=3155914 RepID=UPI00340648BD
MGGADVRVRDEVDAMAAAWQRDGLPPSVITLTMLSKRVARLNQMFEHAARAELVEIGLTYAEFDVLAALRRVGEPYRLRPSELARSLYLTSGGTSNVLQRLTKAGYVEREPDPGDARSRWVQLTPEGLDVAETALNAVIRSHGEAMAGVPEEALHHAADALREITAVVGRRRYR